MARRTISSTVEGSKSCRTRADSIRENSISANFSTVNSSVKASARILVSFCSTTHRASRMCRHTRCICCLPSAVSCRTKPSAWWVKKPVLQLLIHPPDAGQGILKNHFVLRMVEDIAPDAFHCSTQQFGLGCKVIVDAPHRDPTGSGHRADVYTCPSVLLDKLPAGF